MSQHDLLQEQSQLLNFYFHPAPQQQDDQEPPSMGASMEEPQKKVRRCIRRIVQVSSDMLRQELGMSVQTVTIPHLSNILLPNVLRMAH